MILSLIVAMASDRAIGRDNELLWHISEDFRYFKKTTMGAPIVMGRKTYESIGRPLPGRRNVVLSRDPSLKIEGCECFTSLEAACLALEDEKEIFVIGGGQIYNQAIDVADRLYITEVGGEYEADTYFPEIKFCWIESRRESYPRGEKFDKPFAFVVYRRGDE